MQKHEFPLYGRKETVIQWLATFYLQGTRSEMTCRNGKYKSRERVALARRCLIKHEIATITDGTCSLIFFIADGICRAPARVTAG
jgi:hypothetical protein